MPIDGLSAREPRPPSPFVSGIGLGIGIPFAANPLAGLGGRTGFFVALAALTLAALTVGGFTVDRLCGVFVGFGITIVLAVVMLPVLMQGV